MSKTIRSVAAEARKHYYRGEREAAGIGKILFTKDDLPEWVDAMNRAAHDNMRILPDDWRYEFIGDALDHLSELDDDDSDPHDTFRDWFDGAYIYTHQQTAWLASRNERLGYCDEVAEEYGSAMTFSQCLFLGMLREAEEVFEAVLRACVEQVEAEEVEA